MSQRSLREALFARLIFNHRKMSRLYLDVKIFGFLYFGANDIKSFFARWMLKFFSMHNAIVLFFIYLSYVFSKSYPWTESIVRADIASDILILIAKLSLLLCFFYLYYAPHAQIWRRRTFALCGQGSVIFRFTRLLEDSWSFKGWQR